MWDGESHFVPIAIPPIGAHHNRLQLFMHSMSIIEIRW